MGLGVRSGQHPRTGVRLTAADHWPAAASGPAALMIAMYHRLARRRPTSLKVTAVTIDGGRDQRRASTHSLAANNNFSLQRLKLSSGNDAHDRSQSSGLIHYHLSIWSSAIAWLALYESAAWRWLRLRVVFDSTAVRPRYDHSTPKINKWAWLRPNGCHCGLNDL